MNLSHEQPVPAVFLEAAVNRDIFGGVDCVTASFDGWTVYVHDPDDLPACKVLTWCGLPVKYAVLPSPIR